MANTRGHESGRNKPRASQACIKCRRRKIKCIGLAPGQSCESCKSLNVTCNVSESGDGRRHGTREQFDAMQARLSHLESVLTEQAQTQPQPQPQIQPQSQLQAQTQTQTISSHSLFHSGTLSASGVRGGLLNGEHADQSQAPGGSIEPERVPSSNNDELMMENDPNIIVLPLVNGCVPTPSPSLPRNHSSPGIGVSMTAPQVQRRTSHQPLKPFREYVDGALGMQATPSSDQNGHLEVLTPDGQPSYYGPTSQRYLKDYQPYVSEHSDGKDNETELKMNAAPSRNFLLQIFFRTQPLSTPVVNQALFEAGRAVGLRAQWYSRFLENAILACASRMSPSHDLRQSGAKHADRAAQAILEEISMPNNATLQGLLLLSDFEATRGRNRLGYIYCGIACRLVFDLGLTASCTTLIAKGKMLQGDAFERHGLLLAAHVFDKLWSVYMGRPSAIPTGMVAAAHQRLVGEGWSGSATVEHWVGLCTDMSDATELLVTNPEPSPSIVERLEALNERVVQRFSSLPAELATSLDQAFELQPNAYALCIQFYGAQIVIRGLLNKAMRTVQGDTLPASTMINQQEQHDTERPSQDMLGNAIAIARLISTYHDIYGVENIVTVMLDNMYVASAVLVSYILHATGPQSLGFGASPRTWLESLRDILRSARRHYPVATRMSVTLSNTVQGTLLAGMYDFAPTDNGCRQNNSEIVIGPGQQTDGRAYGQGGQTFDTSTNVFDGNQLEDVFGENFSAGPTGNIMDWLSFGLETGRDVMAQP